MTLSELILLIHWEVQKSFNLVEELTSTSGSDNAVNVRLGMEKFEITIPISIGERDEYYSSINRQVEDERFKKFYYPLIIQSDKEIKGKAKRVAAKKVGKVLDVSVSTKEEKSSSGVKFGHMTITLSRTHS